MPVMMTMMITMVNKLFHSCNACDDDDDDYYGKQIVSYAIVAILGIKVYQEAL